MLGNAADKIIVALDCSPDEARSLAAKLSGHARWLKVGMTLYYTAGPKIVQEFRDLGFRVFIDLKLHDIPHQVRGAARSIILAGADMITVHAIGGQQMLSAALEGMEEGLRDRISQSDDVERPTILAITVLTSIDQQAMAGTGVSGTIADQVCRLASLAVAAGLDGVVASPQEAAILRELLGDEALIVTPGVRPVAAATDDQSRVSTPAATLGSGASYLVIGRPITAAKDPVQAFDDIVRSINI